MSANTIIHKIKRNSTETRKRYNLYIHELPPEPNGKYWGDLEMDLIVGAKGKGEILVVTDRMTSMIWAKKLKNKSSAEVHDKLWTMLIAYKRHLKIIVTDNGSEFVHHEEITPKLGVPIFFAAPYAA